MRRLSCDESDVEVHEGGTRGRVRRIQENGGYPHCTLDSNSKNQYNMNILINARASLQPGAPLHTHQQPHPCPSRDQGALNYVTSPPSLSAFVPGRQRGQLMDHLHIPSTLVTPFAMSRPPAVVVVAVVAVLVLAAGDGCTGDRGSVLPSPVSTPVRRHVGRWTKPPTKCPSSMVTGELVVGCQPSDG